MPGFDLLPPALVGELLALGLCAGFMAGLFGIGGGMLLVPFMTIILSHRGVQSSVAVKMAIATSMATILFTSLSSVRAHHQRGAVRWPLVRGMAPGILVGGLLAGGGAFALLKGQALALVFGLFVAFPQPSCCEAGSPRPTATCRASGARPRRVRASGSWPAWSAPEAASSAYPS